MSNLLWNALGYATSIFVICALAAVLIGALVVGGAVTIAYGPWWLILTVPVGMALVGLAAASGIKLLDAIAKKVWP